MASTTVPPPANRLNATPVLRTWTNWMPMKNLRLSPIGIPVRTRCLASWSIPTTTSASAPARPNAATRVRDEAFTCVATGSAGDRVHDDRAHQPEHDDRHQRREVDHPQRRDEPAEDPQVGLADVA